MIHLILGISVQVLSVAVTAHGMYLNGDDGYWIRVGVYFAIILSMLCYLINQFLIETIKKIFEESEKSENLTDCISHEIRNPLMGITNSSNELLINLKDKNSIYDEVENINEEGKLILESTNNLLDFSSWKLKNVKWKNVKFNFNEILKNIKSTIIKRIKNKNIDFNVVNNANDDEYYYLGDPVKLERVLMNLLKNAFKFTNKGTVTLSINPDDKKTDKFNIIVKDTGIGISNVDTSLIFEPFQHGNDEILKKFGGSGLGLYISQKLLTSVNSKINVNNNEHLGSTFKFSLYFKSVKKPKIKIVKKKVSDNRIIFCDDNKMLNFAISRMLKQLEYKVTCCFKAAEVLEKFKTNTWDLLITDKEMDKMDGVELSTILKTKYKSNLKIIMLTGDLSIESYKNVDKVLFKPINKDQLQLGIKSLYI